MAAASTRAVTVKVTLPPPATVTISLMLPLPEAAHEEPALAAQVQVAPLTAAGKVSVTVASMASLGPGLVTAICHCTLAPGTTGLVSVVLEIATSPIGSTVSITVSLSLPGRCR